MQFFCEVWTLIRVEIRLKNLIRRMLLGAQETATFSQQCVLAVLLDSDRNGGSLDNDRLETTIQSFIIKIWREEADPRGTQKWRGHITHVPSDERRYLESLSDILGFMTPYLQAMGVHVGFGRRLMQWLSGKYRTVQRP
jgi:hypothetical protein